MHLSVTVLIPSYNAAGTLARAIDSALSQEGVVTQIIAVDDKSTDETPSVLRRYADRGLITIVERDRNGGQSAAINTGIDAAENEFIAFLDADDEWMPGKLLRQASHLLHNPSASFVGCWAEASWSSHRRRDLVNGNRQPPTGPDAWKSLLRESFYVPSEVMTRLSLLKRVKGMRENLPTGCDQDLFIRLALLGEVEFIDDVLAVMYPSPSGLSLTYSTKEIDIVLPMIIDHCAALKDRLTPAEARQIIRARRAHYARNLLEIDPKRGVKELMSAMLAGEQPMQNTAFMLKKFAQSVLSRVGVGR